jgi:hypothetical protein
MESIFHPNPTIISVANIIIIIIIIIHFELFLINTIDIWKKRLIYIIQLFMYLNQSLKL